LKSYIKRINWVQIPDKNYQFLQPITRNSKAVNSPGSVDKQGGFWYQYQYNIMIFIKIQNEDSDYIVAICGELDPKRNKKF
jgi:hypothetical protein